MSRRWQPPAELHQRFCAGDPKVTDELFEHIYIYVGSTYSGSLTQQDHEDIAQETLLYALDHVDQLKTPDAFVGWLKKIAWRKAYHLHEKQGGVISQEEVANFENLAYEESFVEQLVRNVGLSQEIKNLTPNEKEALYLTQINNLSYEQAAQRSGRTKASIAQAVSGAFQKLRAALGDA